MRRPRSIMPSRGFATGLTSLLAMIAPVGRVFEVIVPTVAVTPTLSFISATTTIVGRVSFGTVGGSTVGGVIVAVVVVP